MVAARGYKSISSKLLISLPNTKKKIVGWRCFNRLPIQFLLSNSLYDNQNTPRVYIINKHHYLSLYCILPQSLNFGSLQPSQKT